MSRFTCTTFVLLGVGFTLLGCADSATTPTLQRKEARAQRTNSSPYTVYVENVRLGTMTSEEAVDAYVRKTGGRAIDLAFELWKEGLLLNPADSTSNTKHKQSVLSK